MSFGWLILIGYILFKGYVGDALVFFEGSILRLMSVCDVVVVVFSGFGKKIISW